MLVESFYHWKGYIISLRALTRDTCNKHQIQTLLFDHNPEKKNKNPPLIETHCVNPKYTAKELQTRCSHIWPGGRVKPSGLLLQPVSCLPQPVPKNLKATSPSDETQVEIPVTRDLAPTGNWQESCMALLWLTSTNAKGSSVTGAREIGFQRATK